MNPKGRRLWVAGFGAAFCCASDTTDKIQRGFGIGSQSYSLRSLNFVEALDAETGSRRGIDSSDNKIPNSRRILGITIFM